MGMAPLGVPPAEAFAPLPRIAGAVRAAYPEAVIVSAGMSGDLEYAIAAGATHVRVGTALLGGPPGFVRECPSQRTAGQGRRRAYGWPAPAPTLPAFSA